MYFKDFCQEINISKNTYSLKGEYVFSSSNLWGIGLKDLDPKFTLKNNILYTKYSTGIHINPAYVAYYGLLGFSDFCKNKTPRSKQIFLDQCNFLANYGTENADNFYTPYKFDWQNGESVLKNGWISGMAQGLVVSLFIRAYYFLNDDAFLHLAKKAANCFKQDLQNGGVRAKYKTYEYPEEYPSYPLSQVLDGILFGFVGLFEISKIDDSFKSVFEKQISFIQDNFSLWNFYGIWTRYGEFNGIRLLSTASYNALNKILLEFFLEQNLLNLPKIKSIPTCLASILNLPKAIFYKVAK